MNARWAARVAGLVHDLHRVRLPLTRRVLWPFNVKVAAALLGDVHDVFGARGVSFWLRDGTALGAWRDGGLIPHDDDIDLGVWAADEEKLAQALGDLERRGFIIYRRDEYVVGLLSRGETVELCFSGRRPPTDEHTKVQEAFFSERRHIDFLGRRYEVPQDMEGYLAFCYGTDWRVPKFGAWWSNSWWLPPAAREANARKYSERVRPKTKPGAHEAQSSGEFLQIVASRMLPASAGPAKVSVIICTHNRFEGLRRAIASVRAQTHRHIELIIVNDGSSDPRYRAEPRAADEIWIDQPENSRVRFGFPCLGHVKNIGLARATGDFVAFLDDDDEWLPGKLAAQFAELRATGCRMSATEAWCGEGPFEAGKKYPRYLAERTKHDALPPRFTLADIARDNLIIHSSILIERSLVAEMGGYDELPLGGVWRDGRFMVEDWELWQRCLRVTDCAFVREPQLYYDEAHGRPPSEVAAPSTAAVAPRGWWRRLWAARA